ncbi:putative hydroxymethylpyrimidine transporter CytX [Latilactobacillus sakei]
MKVNHNQFLLWFGAAISIAEIITGTLIAPLGLVKGSLAIIIGHLIGAFLLLLPASFLGGTRHQNAIELTDPIYGKIGFILFAILNVIQLIGWTGIMIANAAQAMQQLKLTHLSYLMNAIIVAGLIIFWLAIKTQFFFKLNNSIVLLLVVACLGLFWQLSQFAGHTTHLNANPLSFGAAIELSIAMALSWLPLIADYTKDSKKPLALSLWSTSGYFLGSLMMFFLGFLTIITTGYTDFNQFLATSRFGFLILFTIIFSTITTTFLDAYSAGVNLKNLFPKIRYSENGLGIVVTLIGLGLIANQQLFKYELFLTLISAAFTPLYTIVFFNYFYRRLPIAVNFSGWLLGAIAYYGLQHFDFP